MSASCIFSLFGIRCGVGNPLSRPPGEYDRKVKTQRNWRGGTQPVEHVVQFDTNQRTSPGFEIQASYPAEMREIRKKAWTGAAWLSSVRSVRSALKWDNERNPHLVLYMSQETASILIGEEGGADVKSAWSLYPGLHTCYNGQKQWAAQACKCKQIPQICPQLGLRSATRPHELGIGSNRGSATPR
jgi:hypothetical protein